MVQQVDKEIEAGAGTGIIIHITKDLVHDHHKDSVKTLGIIMVISMAVDHPPQISHLMPHNQKLMTNMRNASNRDMKMRRMSNRVMVIIEDEGNLLTQNQQTAVSVPPTMSANPAESDLLSQTNCENLIPDNVGPAISGQLAEVAKRYWVEKSRKVPVVAKIVERLKMLSN